MKIKGAEFMEWYDNHFPDGHYFDSDGDAIETHNNDGSWALDPTETYDTDELGYLARHQHHGERVDPVELDSEIKKWRRKRDYDVVTCLVPKVNRELFDVALKRMKIKTVK